MSRTYKDKPFKFKEDDYSLWGFRREDKPKKPKTKDTEYHWLSTPSWWTKMFMVRPRRNAENRSLKAVQYVQDLEDFDFVDVRRKLHIYYW